MSSNLAAMRANSALRSKGASTIGRSSRRIAPRRSSASWADSGRPLASMTSSARWMRWRSLGGCARPRQDRAERAPHAAPASPAPPHALDPAADLLRRPPAGARGPIAAREIKHRAANEKRHAPARRDRRRRGASVSEEARRRIAVGRIDEVDEMMRRPREEIGSQAWPCRCPCRGKTIAASTLTISSGKRSTSAAARIGLARAGRAHQEYRGTCA
jgi:hypothetical protein